MNAQILETWHFLWCTIMHVMNMKASKKKSSFSLLLFHVEQLVQKYQRLLFRDVVETA